MIDWRAIQAGLKDFDAEDLFESGESQIRITKVLSNLTPAQGAEPWFVSEGHRLLASWRTDAGVAVVRFNYCVVSRRGLSGVTGLRSERGVFVVARSDLVTAGSQSWIGRSLSTSDQFSCGHWIVSFGHDDAFEAVASRWCSYVVLDTSVDLWSFIDRYSTR